VSGTTVSYNQFTGGHYGWADSDREFQRGELLIATGKNKTTYDRPFGEGETVYGIDVTDQPYDKRVLGVYAGPLETESGTWTLVFAVGDGFILVTDTGGDIEVGDYITSSGHAGYGQKQDQETLMNYTVCKSMSDIDWDEVEIDPERGFKWKLIACTYKAG
jgi:hypothetical protein